MRKPIGVWILVPEPGYRMHCSDTGCVYDRAPEEKGIPNRLSAALEAARAACGLTPLEYILMELYIEHDAR